MSRRNQARLRQKDTPSDKPKWRRREKAQGGSYIRVERTTVVKRPDGKLAERTRRRKERQGKSRLRWYALCIVDTHGNVWCMEEHSFSMGWSYHFACLWTSPPNHYLNGLLPGRKVTARHYDKGQWWKSTITIAEAFITRVHSDRCPIQIDMSDTENKVHKGNWKFTRKAKSEAA